MGYGIHGYEERDPGFAGRVGYSLIMDGRRTGNMISCKALWSATYSSLELLLVYNTSDVFVGKTMVTYIDSIEL